MRTRTCTATSIGDRQENEDRVVVIERDGMILLVLADGMGGHEMGGEAAEAAVDRVADLFPSYSPDDDPAGFLVHALEQAHRSVFMLGQDMPVELRPRTTLVAALLVPPRLWTTHAGDSRCYVFREGQTILRTADHTHVEDLIAAGDLDESARGTHPMRNLVEKCLGGDPELVSPDSGAPTELATGDVVLLCSDGFWDPLDMDEAAQVLANCDDCAKTLDEMAAIACKFGSPHADNATAAMLRIEKD